MISRLARFALALPFAVAACTATPELKFAPDGVDTDAATDATVPLGGQDAQGLADAHPAADTGIGGGNTDDSGDSPDAPIDTDALSPDSSGPPVDASSPDAGPHDAGPPDTAAPPDSGPVDAGHPDAAATCTPNPQLGIDCCPSGDQCVGLACQNCQDCTTCGLPNFCCAVVNGAGKYKSMKCSMSSVGCP